MRKIVADMPFLLLFKIKQKQMLFKILFYMME